MHPTRRLSFYFMSILLMMGLAACNLPVKSPTPIVFSTVDLTQTAIFNPTAPLPMTATAGVQATATIPVITATAEPSETALPPTPTPPPPTATAVPPTATSVPTNTAVPPTATIPAARTGPKVVAPFLTTAPVIDGSWNDLPSSTETAANYVVYRNPKYSGSAKAGMSFRIGWNNKYLFIAVKVGDPLYHQGETGENLYLGDSLEVLLDTDVSDDYYSTSLTSDDYHLGISPGFGTIGKNTEAYLWNPVGMAGSRTAVKIAATNPSAGLYRIEVAIPWSLFGITPSDGMHLGFVLSYSDNESESENQQSLMISNDKNRVYTDPTTWGDLFLTD